MRVLLSTIGSRGDVQPLVALALELRALGADPRFCTPPDFRAWIEGLGFEVTPIGPELRAMTATPRPAGARPLSPELRRQMAESTVAAQFTTIDAAAEGCDAIVAATALQIAARSVAERRGARYQFVAYGPNVLPSPHHAPPPLPPVPGEAALPDATGNAERWRREAARFTDLFGPALNAHRASRGLAPVDDVRAHVLGESPWLAADPALAPWPDPAGAAVTQHGAWIAADERPLDPEVEAFLGAGEPPVYFGFGSIRGADDAAEVMVRSARALGRRVLLSRGWGNLSPIDDGRDCLAIGEVNLQSLFARVAAVVHHGGAGTTTVAAMAGVPQVVVPQMYDQHYFAARVDALGIGVAHAPGAAAVPTLTGAIERALGPEVTRRARAFAPLVRRDGGRAAALELLSNL